ncbi:MAG: peptidoglycan-binding domain-containing protein, partial [Acidimicrobiales bacterium]
MAEKLTKQRVTRHVVAVPIAAAVAVVVMASPALAIHTGRQPAPAPSRPAAPAPSPVPAPPNLVAAILAALFPPAKPPAQAAAPPSPTTTVPTIPTLDVGASNDVVKIVEQKLDALKYFMGAVDGKYDEDTKQAVLAFQKVHNLARTGVMNQTVFNALQTARDPAPLVPSGAG